MKRICKKCSKTLDLSEFHNQKAGKGGKRSRCKVCTNSENKVRNDDNKDHISKYHKEWYKDNKDVIREKRQEYVKRNRGRVKELRRLKYLRDKDAPAMHSANRRARKRNATPIWLNTEHLAEIKDIYKNRRLLSDSGETAYEVHHIIPLQQHRDMVCGLHVPWNLKVLTKEEHIKAHYDLKKEFGGNE